MPLIRAKNELLIDKREATFMTASAAAAATSITVQDNSNFVTNNDYYLVGKIGSETAEIIQNNASTTLGTNITFDGGGGTGGGLAFAHPINTPVYRIDFNQVAFYNSSTTTAPAVGSYITNGRIALQMDDTYTRFQDTTTTSTTSYYFVRFYNSTTAAYSDVSPAVPFAGPTIRSLWEIARKVYRLLGLLDNDDMDENAIKFSEIKRAINDKQREIVHERLWTFAEGERSFATVANQFRYVPSATSVNIINSVSHDSKPLRYVDHRTWELLHIDSDSTSTFASRFSIWNNEIWLDPKPSTAASSTAINDAAGISTTATSVTIDSNSGFRATGGFYRFIIDSEVIYATGTTSTTFTGLLRAREGTTAATHADDAAVTERDIVYSYQIEPEDLTHIASETVIPEPEGLAFGVAEDFARGSLRDNNLADRLKIKYDEWLKKLRNKYSKKIISSFSAVKDYMDVVDAGSIRNPNDYPSSLS